MIENVTCPVCDGPMVSRSHKKTGQRFWGCRAWPECHGTRHTDEESARERVSEDDSIDSLLPSERAHANDKRRW